MTTRRVIDPAGALFGLGLPLLSALAVLALTVAWQPRLPDRIATHWTGLTADSFGSAMSSAWTMALLIVLIGGGCCAIAALAQAQLIMRRYMLVLGLGVTGLMLTVHVAGLAGQLDLADPAQAPFPMWSIGAGMFAGVAVGWVGAALLRDYRERKPATAPPDPELPRGRVETPIVEQVGTGPRTTVVLVLIVMVPALLVCAATGSWWMPAIVAPLGFLVLSLLRFLVIVDERGLRVRNLGTTAVAYDLDEIVSAKVTQTRPFQDWGGWGLRVKGRGRYGLVTNTGPAVVVTTASGHEFTVTTDRAEEMAGALNTLADRRSAASTGGLPVPENE
ncbi:DUF1648 domain-containing protein [Rhodococcus chondri]|uniref:DUF1648 domain-containing protein n=1 Tax=Rhodococcus chondri TaxID=3065941 RepID=A0ABU7JYI9_9NOCA|nr:DUF1648 domain-containing protein [Rhodococcus sp. CC-R104]MEE2035072.1 DUF1648 domain-containing protein [Rhodococcus sp. CC-R104]